MRQRAHRLVRGRAAVAGIALAGVIALVLGPTAAADPSAGDRPVSVAQATDRPASAPITAPSGTASAGDSVAADAVAVAATNLTYNTVDACRAFDSRQFSSSPIPPNFGFDIGITGGCGVPADGTVQAIMVNMISVGARGTGYVRAAPYPFETNSNATVLNFNGGLVSSNGIPLSICDASVEFCEWDFDFFVFGSSTHIVIDVIGYFAT
jgi:hypothetical protein